MSAIQVVTDSGADLGPELRRREGLHVVPLTITFGEQEFRDGVDLTPEAFYERLSRAEGASLPRTTQPSPADFEAVYRALVAQGSPVLSIHLSSRLSGTYQSAVLAAREVGGEVYVVDSRSASFGIGLMVLEALRLAEAGMAAPAIRDRIEELRRQTEIFFSVDTLEFLQRNGRIGRAQAFVGGLLNVKPILRLVDGVVHPVERVRTRARAFERLVSHGVEAAGGRPVRVGVLHGNAPEAAGQLAEALKGRLQVEELYVAPLGATIGTHAGPGTLGFVLQPVLPCG